MVKELERDLKTFLTDMNLSSYCINVYLSLLNSSTLSAKEITQESGVPIGRIYEVLDELETKGMIQIHDSRPKTVRALPLNIALYNLITFYTKKTKRKVKYLYDQAKVFEKRWEEYKPLSRISGSPSFYSTVLGSKKILSIYSQWFDELEEELLVNEYVNRNTIQVLSFAEDFFTQVRKVLDRGVQIKILLSCEYDDRPLSIEEKEENNKLISEIKDKHQEFGLSNDNPDFEMRYFIKRMPLYFDIFDKNRIIFKLQNPTDSWQIFASVNLIDPLFAEELRKIFHNVWYYEAQEM